MPAGDQKHTMATYATTRVKASAETEEFTDKGSITIGRQWSSGWVGPEMFKSVKELDMHAT